MPKDALLYARLQQLGLAGRTFRPEPPSPNTLALAHDPAYVRSFLDGSISPAAMRRIGLPWSEALVRRALVGVGSAVLAARLALQFGVAVMCNGGTHHAHPAHGSGKPWRQGGVGRGGSQRRAGGSPCLPGGSSMPAPAGPAAPPPQGPLPAPSTLLALQAGAFSTTRPLPRAPPSATRALGRCFLWTWMCTRWGAEPVGALPHPAWPPTTHVPPLPSCGSKTKHALLSRAPRPASWQLTSRGDCCAAYLMDRAAAAPVSKPGPPSPAPGSPITRPTAGSQSHPSGKLPHVCRATAPPPSSAATPRCSPSRCTARPSPSPTPWRPATWTWLCRPAPPTSSTCRQGGGPGRAWRVCAGAACPTPRCACSHNRLGRTTEWAPRSMPTKQPPVYLLTAGTARGAAPAAGPPAAPAGAVQCRC